MDKRYVIAGCGGHARSVADVILSNDSSNQILFVDDNAKENEQIFGFDVIKEFPQNLESVILASGDNKIRKEVSFKFKTETIISNKAHIGMEAIIEEGCFVAQGAHIGPKAAIKKGSIINTNAVAEHDVKVGEFCHIAPNSTLCGGCVLGENVFVGAGAVVKQYVKICSNVTIGAGAVVINDITQAGVYVGCPAKFIEVNNE